MSGTVFWVGLGALGGLALLGLLKLIAPSRLDIGVFGAMCSIYAIYVGLAIAEPPGVVIGEAAIAVLVPLLALAFWSQRAVLLPALLIAHAGLDLVHHLLSAGFPPVWYVQACLSLDVVFALGAYLLMRQGRTV